MMRIVTVWLALLMLPSCMDGQASAPDRSAEAEKTRAVASLDPSQVTISSVDLTFNKDRFNRRLGVDGRVQLAPQNIVWELSGVQTKLGEGLEEGLCEGVGIDPLSCSRDVGPSSHHTIVVLGDMAIWEGGLLVVDSALPFAKFEGAQDRLGAAGEVMTRQDAVLKVTFRFPEASVGEALQERGRKLGRAMATLWMKRALAEMTKRAVELSPQVREAWDHDENLFSYRGEEEMRPVVMTQDRAWTVMSSGRRIVRVHALDSKGQSSVQTFKSVRPIHPKQRIGLDEHRGQLLLTTDLFLEDTGRIEKEDQCRERKRADGSSVVACLGITVLGFDGVNPPEVLVRVEGFGLTGNALVDKEGVVYTVGSRAGELFLLKVREGQVTRTRLPREQDEGWVTRLSWLAPGQLAVATTKRVFSVDASAGVLQPRQVYLWSNPSRKNINLVSPDNKGGVLVLEQGKGKETARLKRVSSKGRDDDPGPSCAIKVEQLAA